MTRLRKLLSDCMYQIRAVAAGADRAPAARAVAPRAALAAPRGRPGSAGAARTARAAGGGAGARAGRAAAQPRALVTRRRPSSRARPADATESPARSSPVAESVGDHVVCLTVRSPTLELFVLPYHPIN